jgi:hypothetical protein
LVTLWSRHPTGGSQAKEPSNEKTTVPRRFREAL